MHILSMNEIRRNDDQSELLHLMPNPNTKMSTNQNSFQSLSFCNTLQDDDIGYSGYLERLTYLLFGKGR